MFGRFADRNEHGVAFELDAMDRRMAVQPVEHVTIDGREARSGIGVAKRQQPNHAHRVALAQHHDPVARPSLAIARSGDATPRAFFEHDAQPKLAQRIFVGLVPAGHPRLVARDAHRRRAGWDGRNRATDR